MNLFTSSRLAALEQAQGSGHPYLSLLASQRGERLRARLSEIAGAAPSPLQDRWASAMDSTDMPRFFQGYCELTTAAFLIEAGWTVTGYGAPGPSLQIERTVQGKVETARVLVLAFIQPGRRAEDTQAISRLVRSLNRARTRNRFAVLVRKWHPHDFDPEPIRRAVDLWLRKVARGQWEGRAATFADEHVALEFILTDRTTRTGEGSVAFAMGPLDGFKTLEVVETRLVFELDAYQLKGDAEEPLIVSLATNGTWALSPGFLRGMLYGRPTWHQTNGAPHRQEMAFGDSDGPALFQDPIYSRVAAALVMDQQQGLGPCARAYLNPWSPQLAHPGIAGCATFAVDRWDAQTPVMRWFGASG